MKIITVLGARPQFIKAGAVSRVFANHKEIEEIIVHTGQHYDKNMSDYFFNQLEIPKPKYNLQINGLNHGAMTGQMMEKIRSRAPITQKGSFYWNTWSALLAGILLISF